MNQRPVSIKVHPKFRDLMHLEAAFNGETMVKYTEKISQEQNQIKDIAEEWKKKYGGRTKPQKGYLDFP